MLRLTFSGRGSVLKLSLSERMGSPANASTCPNRDSVMLISKPVAAACLRRIVGAARPILWEGLSARCFVESGIQPPIDRFEPFLHEPCIGSTERPCAAKIIEPVQRRGMSGLDHEMLRSVHERRALAGRAAPKQEHDGRLLLRDGGD